MSSSSLLYDFNVRCSNTGVTVYKSFATSTANHCKSGNRSIFKPDRFAALCNEWTGIGVASISLQRVTSRFHELHFSPNDRTKETGNWKPVFESSQEREQRRQSLINSRGFAEYERKKLRSARSFSPSKIFYAMDFDPTRFFFFLAASSRRSLSIFLDILYVFFW